MLPDSSSIISGGDWLAIVLKIKSAAGQGLNLRSAARELQWKGEGLIENLAAKPLDPLPVVGLGKANELTNLAPDP